MARNPDEKNNEKKPEWERHVFMGILSGIIIITVLFVSYMYSNEIYNIPEKSPTSLIPFTTCLAGVLLFIMGVSRRKREDWTLRKYWGDYCYRIAQAFAYLLIVLWAWSTSDKTVGGTDIPSNILGFLVGFFILRVERAMESLGEKFEEVLMSVLPRSVRYKTIQEKRRQQLRDTYKLEEVTTQYETLRPVIDNSAVKQEMDKKIEEAAEAAGKDNPEDTKKKIDSVVRAFEDVRQGLNESVVSVEDLISPRKT